MPLPGCDVQNVIDSDLWYRLGFQSQADLLAANWLTVGELYQFADDAVKAIARATSLFLTFDDSIAVSAGTAAYALPAGHIFTEGAWLVYASGGIQLLRLTTVGQLFALDAVWGTKTGAPVRLSLDARDAVSCVLYPSPTANATLAQIMQQTPADVAEGATALPLSPVMEIYFSSAILAAALSKESDSARPEVAAHLVERLGLIDAVIQSLWGEGR